MALLIEKLVGWVHSQEISIKEDKIMTITLSLLSFES